MPQEDVHGEVHEEIVDMSLLTIASESKGRSSLTESKNPQERVASLDIFASDETEQTEAERPPAITSATSPSEATPWRDQFRQIKADLDGTIQFSRDYQRAYENSAIRFDKSFFFKHRESGVKNSRKVMTELEKNILTACKEIEDAFAKEILKKDPSNDDISQYKEKIGRAIIKAVEQKIKQEKFSSYKSHSFRAYLHGLHRDLRKNDGLITSKIPTLTIKVIEESLKPNNTDNKMSIEKQIKAYEKGVLLEQSQVRSQNSLNRR